MTSSIIAKLQKKNDDLRQLVIRLGTIMLADVVEHRTLAEMRGSITAPLLLAATMPAGIVDHLREMALRCGEVSRDCCDSDTARALESLSVQLAAEAETLERQLRGHESWRLPPGRSYPPKR
jgi:hypothetical protein